MSKTIKSAKNFSFPIRVYVEDTDAGGIVFYANYLKFMERARTEFMRDLGYEQLLGHEQLSGFEKKLSSKSEAQFVVHSADMKFLKPARMDMLLSVTVVLQKLAKSYFIVSQQVLDNKGETIFCQAEVKIACIDNQKFKPQAMPEFVYSGLQERL